MLRRSGRWPRLSRRTLAVALATLLVGQALLVGATYETPPREGDAYGIARTLEVMYSDLNDRYEQPGIEAELTALRLLHQEQELNLTLLADHATTVAALNASEEVNATIEYAPLNFSYRDRGFVPVVVDDPVPVRAHIMDYILESNDIIQDTGGGTLLSFFLDTYLIYWAYDANGNGTIESDEEGLVEANLIDAIAGASTAVLIDWVDQSVPEPARTPLMLMLGALDETALSWVELDVDNDGEDDIRVRMVPIIRDILSQSDLTITPPAVTVGAKAGLTFELEEINKNPELAQPLEVAVIRGLTYPGEGGEDLTYVWTVDTEFSHVPDTYTWEVLMENFSLTLGGGAVNADDLTAINPPYILHYVMNNVTGDPLNNGIPWHTLTPGYIRYDWNSGSTREEAMEDMTFIKLALTRPGGRVPAELEVRLLADEGDDWESDTVEFYAENTNNYGPFNLDLQYYEYKEEAAEVNPFMSHIVAHIEGVPVCNLATLDGCLPDPRHPRSSLWLEVVNYSTPERKWTTLDLRATSPIPYLLYGDYEYYSESDRNVTYWDHDYRTFAGVELYEFPAQLHLEGNFWLLSDDDPITLYDDPRLDAVGNLINNIMLAVASKIYSIGLMLRSIPGAILGVSGEGGGGVRITLRNRAGEPDYIGSFAFYYTSHAILELADDSGDDFFAIYNETAFLDVSSPAPGRAAVSTMNERFAFSGRISGLGDIFYQGEGSFRNISLSADEARNRPFRVYFEGGNETGVTDHWANITFSDIPTSITLNMTGGTVDYSGGPTGDPYGDRVMDQITFTSLANDTYTRFQLEHLPGEARVTQDGGNLELVTDSWFNFSFFITNVTSDDNATAWAWAPSYNGSFTLLYRDRVGQPDEIASLAGRLNWMRSLELSGNGDQADLRITHHQAVPFKVGVVDRTDYGNDATAGLNAYVFIDPLPVDITVSVPVPEAGTLPTGSMGNVSSLGDIARLIEALADLGQTVVTLVADLSLNLISSVESFETVVKFFYGIDEEVRVTLWIDKGNLALLPEQPRWVQGFWSSQLEWGGDLILAARLYLVGLPREVTVNYTSRGDYLAVDLDLQHYNHDATADYLLFESDGLLGPRVMAYVAELPVSFDLQASAELTLNGSRDNLTVQGRVNLTTSQPVGPIYLELTGETDTGTPYRLTTLIPRLPRNLTVDLDVAGDRLGLNYTSNEPIEYILVELSVGDASGLATRWVNGASIAMSDDGDISVKAYFRGLPPALSLAFRDPQVGGAWLDLAVEGFNSGLMPPEDLTLELIDVANKSILLHLTDLPVDLDLEASLFLDAPGDDAGFGMASLVANLSLNLSQPLSEAYIRFTDHPSDVRLELALPMVPESLDLDLRIGGDLYLDFATSEPIPEILLKADIGNVSSLDPYWTHGVVYRTDGNATALRLWASGTVTSATLDARLGEPDVITLALGAWSPNLPWAYVDLDMGPASSQLQLFIDDIRPRNDLQAYFRIARNASAGIDVDADFDIRTSTGIGRAYIRSHNRTRPSVTELYLASVPHRLVASVLSGREIDIRYWATDPVEVMWVNLAKRTRGEWRSAYALVHDAPTYFQLSLTPDLRYDMDRSFVLQGLPTISVMTSSPEIDVLLLVDPGFTGGFTGAALDATNLGNHTTLRPEGYDYVIDAPQGIEEAYYRLEGSPTTPQFTLTFLEIHARDVRHVRLTVHQFFGLYPVFELHDAEGGALSYAVGGEMTAGPVELEASAVMLELRFREVRGVPLIPTWLGVQRGGAATDLGDGERHFILPEPVTSLLATLLEAV